MTHQEASAGGAGALLSRRAGPDRNGACDVPGSARVCADQQAGLRGQGQRTAAVRQQVSSLDTMCHSEGRGAPRHGTMMLPSGDAGRLTLKLNKHTARMVDGAPGTSCGALQATPVVQPVGRVGTAKVEPELWAGRWEAGTVLGGPPDVASRTGQRNTASGRY